MLAIIKMCVYDLFSLVKEMGVSIEWFDVDSNPMCFVLQLDHGQWRHYCDHQTSELSQSSQTTEEENIGVKTELATEGAAKTQESPPPPYEDVIDKENLVS